MKLAKRLAKFINKSDESSSDISYWQNKYFSLWEKHPEAIVEIDAGEIVYFNSTAEKLVPSIKYQKNKPLSSIFIHAYKLTSSAIYPQLVELADSGELLLVSLAQSISDSNYYLQLEPGQIDGKPAPLIKLKQATNLLCNALTDGFIATDKSGKIVYTNQSFNEFTGYSQKSSAEKTLFEISPKKWHSFEKKLLQELQVHKKTLRYEKEITDVKGKPQPVEVQAYPYILEENHLGNWFIVRKLTQCTAIRRLADPESPDTIDRSEELLSFNQRLIEETEERKRIENQLVHSEDTFRSFIQQSTEGICILDSSGIIVDWNNAMSELFEVPASSYLFKPVWQLDYDFLPKKKKNETELKKIKKTVSGYLANKGLEEAYEGEYEKEVGGKTKYIHFKVFPIHTAKGRIFGRINREVTKRKTVEIELENYKNHLERLVEERTNTLKRNSAHLQLLIKSMPLAYYSYNIRSKNNIWYSEHIEHLTGYGTEELSAGRDFWEKNINKDDFRLVQGTFDKPSPNQHVSCEYRWKTAYGKEIWIFDQAILIEDDQSQQIIGCFLDITDRKNAEKAIRQSEINYREIFNSASDAILIHHAESGDIEDVNNTMLDMFGITIENAQRISPDQFSQGKPPYDLKTYRNHIAKARKEGFHVFEWMSRNSENQLFWTEITLKGISLNGTDKIMAVIRDIDERKKSDALIRYRNDFEKLIFNISSRFINVPFEEVDRNIEIALKEISEFTHSDTCYLFRYNDVEYTLNLTHFWKKNNIRLDKEKIRNLDLSFFEWHSSIVKNGDVLKMSNTWDIPDEASGVRKLILSMNIQAFIDVPLIYQGVVIGFLGLGAGKAGRSWPEDEISLLQVIGQILVNAIKRKESVQAKLESEQSHREIYNATSEAIMVHDSDNGNIIDVNNAMLDMFGVNYAEALSLSLEDISSSQNGYTGAYVIVMMQKTLIEGPRVFEWQAKRKDGSHFWVEISLKSAEIKGKKRILSVIRDISERKKSIAAIKENEEKYRLLVESQSDLVIKIDTAGAFQFVSPSYCELFGKTEEELLGQKFMNYVHEDDRRFTEKSMENLYHPPYSFYVEQRAFTKSGWRWISWNAKSILNNKQEVLEIVAVGRDITYQKGVEEALRRSEDRFRSIVQHLSDIVIILDPGLNIMYDTPSVKKVLGYDEGVLVGTKLIDLVHPEDLENASKRFQQVIVQSDELVISEIRMKHKSGKYLPLETIGFNLLKHPSIKGIILTLRDISDRKQIEKKVLDAVLTTEEIERERFAKNLHDDLGPLLSSIKMYINSLSTANDTKKQEYIIRQLNEVIKEAIHTTKDVSNDLSPHILINYGLVSAVESFLKKIPADIEVDFNSELTTERYSNTIENSFYRIIKELINNTLKHASASKIILQLTELNQNLQLHYTDNGVGTDINSLKNFRNPGMGLSNIISRAKTLDAIYEFKTQPGKGFSFKISIPINLGLS
jgi:PAS domain S-box-containing protein